MSRSTAAAVATAAALLVAVAARAALAQDTYSSRFDDTDLDAILADEGRVDQYVRCFLAEKDDDCDEVGRRVKAVLAEALTTDCAKCTERQKVGLPKTVRFLARERPDAWEQIQGKFDPKRRYAAAHPELSQ
ncbi:hypothetical protein R5R35_005709 [Gryllus longicercus]|uniref:Chemosensory protein n=1 Tax=Gryllus longicercus TaxID=2509291 RepID=A0AAN9VYB1_9ORTH